MPARPDACAATPVATSPPAFTALGLDGGGSAARWALVDAGGRPLAEGGVAPLAAASIGTPAGDAAARRWVDALVAAVAVASPPGAPPCTALAGGFSGLGGAALPLLAHWLRDALAPPPSAVWLMNDLELACRAAFAPGTGIVVVAGTGSVAGHVDADGRLHRAGGRGALIDDAGSAHWIASRALRHVWRAEDAAPGAWRVSALARRLFQRIGGAGSVGGAGAGAGAGPGPGPGPGARVGTDVSDDAADWDAARAWLRDADRGAVGLLATAVAQAAVDGDAAATALLTAAGRELARPAAALQRRVGAQPVATAGRTWDLHPAVAEAFVAALPAGTEVSRGGGAAHGAAARLAVAAATDAGAAVPLRR